MSYSSLYGIKKDFTGEVIANYQNSWWFSPIVWTVLCEKYLYRKFSFFHTKGEWEMLNTFLNNSRITSDRVCWELSGQGIFLSKDKDFVADSIEMFLADNNKYDHDNEDNIPILKREHIQERFRKIAEDIRENEYEYFVLKNTSVDDAVESWFWDYEHEKSVPLNNPKAEFVIIQDGDIRRFVFAEEYMSQSR